MDLPDFPYTSNYIRVEECSIHYIDEGSKVDPVILFLHGVPTWSFTFRHLFPKIINEGFRVLAPDLPGFGLSEKPVQKDFYSATNMLRFIEGFIHAIGMKKVYIYSHDWGAVLSMILLAQEPEYIHGLVITNGMLPPLDQRLPRVFSFWKLFTKYSPFLPLGRIVDMASLRRLEKAERKGYDYPFSGGKDKLATRIFPQLIPFKGEDRKLVEESWDKLERCSIPLMTIFSNQDPITRGTEKYILDRIPGAAHSFHKKIEGGHFIQEDAPNELAGFTIEFFKSIDEKRM